MTSRSDQIRPGDALIIIINVCIINIYIYIYIYIIAIILDALASQELHYVPGAPLAVSGSSRSGTSRMRLIHSSNQTPRSSNVSLCCCLVV